MTDVHLVLPATMGLAAAEELLAAHAPLRPAALVLSHADATTQLGALVTLAVRHGLPISFLSHDPRRGGRPRPGRPRRARRSPAAVTDDDDVQRRDAVRMPAVLPIELTDGDGNRHETVTRDVSAGGALLARSEALELGQRAWFILDLRPSGGVVEGEVEVVRCDPRGDRAVRWRSLDEGTSDQIVHFVFARQRELAQRRAEAV